MGQKPTIFFQSNPFWPGGNIACGFTHRVPIFPFGPSVFGYFVSKIYILRQIDMCLQNLSVRLVLGSFESLAKIKPERFDFITILGYLNALMRETAAMSLLSQQ